MARTWDLARSTMLHCEMAVSPVASTIPFPLIQDTQVSGRQLRTSGDIDGILRPLRGDAKIVCLWKAPGLCCVPESGSTSAALAIHTALSAVSTLMPWRPGSTYVPAARKSASSSEGCPGPTSLEESSQSTCQCPQPAARPPRCQKGHLTKRAVLWADALNYTAASLSLLFPSSSSRLGCLGVSIKIETLSPVIFLLFPK